MAQKEGTPRNTSCVVPVREADNQPSRLYVPVTPLSLAVAGRLSGRGYNSTKLTVS